MTEHLDDSGVRHWVDALARTRFGVQIVSGKKITSATIKAVGNRMSSYADYKTGTRVRPGLARLAVDLEIGHQTVKHAVTVLRRVGFLRLVSSGGREGESNLYQLVIPVDLLDRDDIEHYSPAKHDLEIERLRCKTRGRGQPTAASMRVPMEPALTGTEPDAPVDNPPMRVDTEPALAPDHPDPSGADARNAGGTTTTDPANAGGTTTEMQVPTEPAISHVPTTTPNTQPLTDLRTAVTASRASPAAQDQISSDMGGDPPTADAPGPCTEHPTQRAGPRADGRLACVFCRALAPDGAAATIAAVQADRFAAQERHLRLITGGAA